MPDEKTSETSEGTPTGSAAGTPEGQAPEGTGTTAGTEGGEGAKPEAKPEDDLPEWAKTELSRVRGEAANYRVKLREAETKLSEAKTPEEFEAATSSLRDVNATLERQILVGSVARKHSLPAELEEALSAFALAGGDQAVLEAQAKKLQKFVPADEDPELHGGLDPLDKDSDSSDPAKLARKYGRGRNKA